MQALTIAFPKIDPAFIHLGPIAIRWYALAYIFGLAFGWMYARVLVRNKALWNKPPGQPSDVDDLILWVTLGVIFGGRLAKFCFTSLPAFCIT